MLTLTLIYLVTILVCLKTADPTPLALLSYLTFILPILDTAFWIRHHDPIPRRGHTFFWIYLAYAGTAAAVKATIVLLALLAAFLIARQQPPLKPFVILLAVMALGWIFSCIIGWIGITLALARRIPVYIIPDLKQRCGGDFENLRDLPLPTRSFDRIILVVTSSLSIPFLATGFLLLALEPQFPGQPWMVPTGFTLLATGALAGVLAIALVSTRISAPTPAAAWPDLR